MPAIFNITPCSRIVWRHRCQRSSFTDTALLHTPESSGGILGTATVFPRNSESFPWRPSRRQVRPLTKLESYTRQAKATQRRRIPQTAGGERLGWTAEQRGTSAGERRNCMASNMLRTEAVKNTKTFKRSVPDVKLLLLCAQGTTAEQGTQLYLASPWGGYTTKIIFWTYY